MPTELPSQNIQPDAGNLPDPPQSAPQPAAGPRHKSSARFGRPFALIGLLGVIFLSCVGAALLMNQSVLSALVPQLRSAPGEEAPDIPATQTYISLGPQVTAAYQALAEDRDKDCIASYNQLIAQMPNWDAGYYNRGICLRSYAALAENSDEYQNRLAIAIADMDQSIRLDPDYGNAYVERAFGYLNLTELTVNMANEKPLLEVAYDNLLAAQALKATHIDGPLNQAIVLLRMDRCKEGLEQAYRVRDQREAMKGLSRAQMGAVYEVMGGGHMCLGEYEKAAPLFDQSLSYNYTGDGEFMMISNLIGMGRPADALDMVNASLEREPKSVLYRYYLRALLYVDQGKFDLARQDLTHGTGYARYRRGLYPYVNSLVLFHDGERDEAIKWLRYAAESVEPDQGLWLRERINQTLKEMEVPFVEPTPSIQLNVTPIPH